MEPGEGVEDGPQLGEAELPIEALTEGFEVDVRRVDRPKEGASRLFRNVARGDGDRGDAHLVAGFRRVDGVFSEDDGIVIGERDAATVVV